MRRIIKQRAGRILFRHLPVSRHVFDHLRLELNAFLVRTNHRILPTYRRKAAALKRMKGLLVNIACGPFGKPDGWINLDLSPIHGLYMRADCRRSLPLGTDSCRGIHVEMFVEHLDPEEELNSFLAECHRALEPGGVLRVIVPDAELFIRAYLSEGWSEINRIAYAGEDWSRVYPGKMEALNHVFQQGYEHYGGWDYDRLERVLRQAGFSRVTRRRFSEGDFPDGPIDRELHRANAVYAEAVK